MILVPFALAQALLLHQAGFLVRDHLGGLAFSLFLFAGLLVLPFCALESVISTLVRIFGVLLGITAGIGGIAFLASTFHPTSKPDLYTPGHDVLSLRRSTCCAARFC